MHLTLANALNIVANSRPAQPENICKCLQTNVNIYYFGVGFLKIFLWCCTVIDWGECFLPRYLAKKTCGAN
jgi:hypothetical protein